MSSGRTSTALVGVACLAWLTVTTGYAAVAAAPSDPVDLGGAALTGEVSTSPASPTPLAPGLWQATLAPSFPQYFSYQRRINDSTVHVGVLGAPQGADGDGIQVAAGVQVGDSTDLTSCGEARDTSEYTVAHAVLGARVIVGDEDGTTRDACRRADTIQIAVTRTSSATLDLPYVIKVVEEAPYSGTGDAPDAEPDADPSYDLPEPAAATDEQGAASFDDAPELDARSGPVTISSTITEGTELLWRVPLTWGDLPVVRVDVPAATGVDAETFNYGGPDLTLHLVDPLRARLRYVNTERQESPTGEYRASETDEPDQLVAAGYPVRTVNGQLPGDHWISLAAEPPSEDRAPVDIPVEITVQVDSGAADGPAYDAAVLSQDKKAGPDGYTPATPFLIAEDTFAAVASGNPVTDQDESDGWLSGRRLAGLGLGVASLACLGGGLLRLRSRR